VDRRGVGVGVGVGFWCWLRLALVGVAKDVLGLFR
jgi:hypothetical protein